MDKGSTKMKRKCSICGSNSKEKLHTQKYLLPQKRNLITYDVVGCKKCGFIYADNIPSQKEYDHYYQNSSKYTYNKNVPKGLLDIYQELYSITEKIIHQDISLLGKTNYHILDVGCSIGTFLHMFKKDGFKHLSGVEPSKDCSRLAKNLYGLEVFPGTLSTYRADDKFDLIIMTGVLEHISDFSSVLPVVTDLLKENGTLMVAVPDAANFSSNPSSPFDEFSIEHINFFTRQSLGNLMNTFRLKATVSESVHAPFYDSTVLVSFYKKAKTSRTLRHDSAGISRVKKYISACRTKLESLEKKFDQLIKSGEGIVVWGVGSLTYRLLTSTCLSKVKILSFVDSNKSLQGKKLMNRKIFSPAFFDDHTQGTVFVASYVYGSEIEGILRNHYHFHGDVIHV